MGFVEEQAQAWAEVRGLWEDSRLFEQRPETADGPLATEASTASLREWLPQILRKYEVGTMLDAACGDWNWMRLVDLTGVEYTGWDVDQGRVDRCYAQQKTLKYGGDCVRLPYFECVNLLTVNAVPCFDLILCRHFVQHLPVNELVEWVLTKFTESGSTYLLTTTYPGADNTFEWDPHGYDHAWKGYFERAVDLEAPPFCLGPKLEVFHEAPAPAGVIKTPHELALFKLD